MQDIIWSGYRQLIHGFKDMQVKEKVSIVRFLHNLCIINYIRSLNTEN